MLTLWPVNTPEQLLAAVHIFVKSTGIPETQVLRGAGVDRQTLWQMRRGKGCHSTTRDTILNFMAAEWERLGKGSREDFLLRIQAARLDPQPLAEPGPTPAVRAANGETPEENER